MPRTEQEVKELQQSEDFRAMLSTSGWKLLVEAAQAEIVRQWCALLTVDPKDIERVRGWIEGANYVLEYGDAAVHKARLVIERDQADRVAAFEAERGAQAAARERVQRRSRMGASLE